MVEVGVGSPPGSRLGWVGGTSTEELGARGMLCRPVRRQGWVRGHTFWMLPSTVEGRNGIPTRGGATAGRRLSLTAEGWIDATTRSVFRAPSLMSSRSMSARIASRGAARRLHVAWMRSFAASKKLDDATTWWGRSSARVLAADCAARIASSCRRCSSTSVRVCSAARAAAS